MTGKNYFKIASMIAALTLLAGSLYAERSMSVCGTGDSQGLLRELSKAYEQEFPGNKIEVPDSIGSGGGVRKTADGKCELGRIARPIKKKEEKYDLHYILFAYSPVVFVTHSSVEAISSLDSRDILAIYRGEKMQWAVFNPSLKSNIYVVNREPGDSSRSVLDANIQGFKEIEKPVGAMTFTTQETVQTLQKHKNTIGYLPLTEASKSGLNILRLDQVAPDEKNILSGKYRLVTPYGLVYAKELTPLAKDFIGFIKSTAVKPIYQRYGAIQVQE